jgi:HK97 family phage major capsid protein
MAAEPVQDGQDFIGQIRTVEFDAEIQVRDESRREIDYRLLPWDTVAETVQGPEEFRRGSMADTRPDDVLLMGLEHEAHIGIGQDGKPVLTRRPIGRAIAFEEKDDGPHATFRVARTQAGDDVLALAADKIVKGVSVEFRELPGGTSVERRGGRRFRVHNRVHLSAVSPTYRPAYRDGSTVLAVRTEKEGDAPMAETTQAPADAGPTQADVFAGQMAALEQFRVQMASNATTNEKILDRIDALEERARQDFTVPNGGVSNDQANAPRKGDWVQAVVRLLTGERVSDRELQTRALADLITTDNAGVVPDAFSQELIGVIDAQRPFMSTTRRMDTPTSGMGLILPKIVTRPSVAVQATEKAELSSTATSITTATYDAETLGGAGDLSLQLLKRSSPEFLGLYLELLAEAMSLSAEDRAVDVLLAASPTAGGVIAPGNLSLGAAWTNSNNSRLRPDTIWMSSAAVAAFIDAKATTTNTPLYSTLSPNITAGGGLGGTISGLRPVHVPTLDNETVKVIVGPSRGFAWAEDGSYTLQVDVPAKAGRDVAMVSIFWFAPLYASAFTTYTLV